MKIAFFTFSLTVLGSMTWVVNAEPNSGVILEKHGRLLELPRVTSAPILDEVAMHHQDSF